MALHTECGFTGVLRKPYLVNDFVRVLHDLGAVVGA
jgi:hypothetical protein